MSNRFFAWWFCCGSIAALWAASRVASAEPDRPAPAGAAAPQETLTASARDTESLINRLDAPQFQDRDRASQRLAEGGPDVIPELIEALGAPSAEVRFRAILLLNRRHSFEQIALPLIEATGKPYASRARVVLRERTLQQLEVISHMPYVEKLFKFWGTDPETFCNQSLIRFNEASDLEQTRQAVEPLIGLEKKAHRFTAAVADLESLSLSYDHQYSPGYVIADTLAIGLRTDQAQLTEFAEQHLQSLKSLASTMSARNEARSAIHKEVLDRANMSQGAAGFLVKLLEKDSAVRTVVSERIGIHPEDLQKSFCQGLADADAHTCDCGVGRVHIVDMLVEILAKWKTEPTDPVCRQLISAITDTARSGDKPRALALLEALDACRSLPNHRLSLEDGLGKQLAERLLAAAQRAANNRAFYPTQSVHLRLVALADMNITPEHPAYPRKLLEQHLAGSDSTTTDDARQAFERYVRILDRLRETGIDCQQSQAAGFVGSLRDALPDHPELLAAGVAQLDQILRQASATGNKPDAKQVAEALDSWAKSAAPSASTGSTAASQ